MGTFHVDIATGSDSNDGSLNAPFATLKYAHDNILSPGDTLQLRGVRRVHLTLVELELGSVRHGPSSPVVVSAYPGEEVIFNNGTLYTWAFLPSTFGGCWTAAYPGLGDYADHRPNRVWVPENDRPLVELQDSSDFATPSSVGGGQLVDGGGHLIYNVVWYDATGGVAYFKSAAPGGVTQVTDPTTQLWTVANGTSARWQFSSDNTQYVTFSGITFKNCLSWHQQSGGMHNGCIVENCKFTGMVQGIVGGGDGMLVQDNWFDLIGPSLSVFSGGAYSLTNLNWGMYVSGQATIRGNLCTRIEGGWMQNGDFLNNALIENNSAYDCWNHTLMGVENVTMQNNIAIKRRGTAAPKYIWRRLDSPTTTTPRSLASSAETTI